MSKPLSIERIKVQYQDQGPRVVYAIKRVTGTSRKYFTYVDEAFAQQVLNNLLMDPDDYRKPDSVNYCERSRVILSERSRA